MQLTRYLQRIGFSGHPTPDLPTLRALQLLHLHAIPYDNLDVRLGRGVTMGLGRGVTMAVTDAYAKLVLQRRGGWCYEMNGLFAWALEEIGFEVTRLGGWAMRERYGADAEGNHVALLVQLDEPYLVDVGFGDGALEPLRLIEVSTQQHGMEFRLERLPDSWWRYHNHRHGAVPSFDFALCAAEPMQLMGRCRWLQQSPVSVHLRNAICVRWVGDRYAFLLERTLRYVGSDSAPTMIDSAAQYREVLRAVFAIDFDDCDALWERILMKESEKLAAGT
jgi:N-hydroxyarylamine O-acetyltransferase